jgi:hypothetical protein
MPDSILQIAAAILPKCHLRSVPDVVQGQKGPSSAFAVLFGYDSEGS